MAQTRAISRVCRSAFAHCVVLIDAELSTTPAEEAEDASETKRSIASHQDLVNRELDLVNRELQEPRIANIRGFESLRLKSLTGKN